jgi:hypothetical protein
MQPANDNGTSRRLPSAAWLAALAVSAAILIYGTFVVLNLTGLR